MAQIQLPLVQVVAALVASGTTAIFTMLEWSGVQMKKLRGLSPTNKMLRSES
jgi:hypothetical protein